MQFTKAMVLFGTAALVSAATPTGSAPAGCTSSVDGTFEISIYNVTKAAKRDLAPRAECGGDSTLILSLKDGVLTDSKDRVGYIASNHQFQFDGPVQSDAIFDAGWSVCGNSSLALGSSANFYRCLSGDFYNLYDEGKPAQCELIAIGAVPCGGASLPAQSVSVSPSGEASAAPVTASADGQPEPTGAAPAVTQITDGQVQAPSAVVSQISDGQIQVPTAATVPSAVVTQIGDGQIQAPTGSGAPRPANSTAPTAISPPIATGAASLNTVAAGAFAVVAGAVAALL